MILFALQYTFDVTLTKDIILITSSLTSTFFAFYGYNKWKKEHKGKYRYELSRAVLKSMYDLRDKFKYLRSPIFRTSEFLPDYNWKVRDVKQRYDNHKYVYENRLKYVADCRNVFLSYLPEVEITFGKTMRDNFLDIDRFLNNFVAIITDYLSYLSEEVNPYDPEYIKLRDYVVYNENDNSYYEEFETLIKQVENRLKKEL